MMLFKPYHVPLVLAGLKTQTRRCWKTQRVTVGSLQKAKTQMLSKDYFAVLKILVVYKQRLGDMTEKDAWAEGGYTLEQYRTVVWPACSKIPWDDDLVVFVIEYVVTAKLVGYVCFHCGNFSSMKQACCAKCGTNSKRITADGRIVFEKTGGG